MRNLWIIVATTTALAACEGEGQTGEGGGPITEARVETGADPASAETLPWDMLTIPRGVCRIEGEAGKYTAVEYDDEGRPVRLDSHDGSVTMWQYEPGLVTETTDAPAPVLPNAQPSRRVVVTRYANSHAVERTETRNDVLQSRRTYEYDADGALVRVNHFLSLTDTEPSGTVDYLYECDDLD